MSQVSRWSYHRDMPQPRQITNISTEKQQNSIGYLAINNHMSQVLESKFHLGIIEAIEVAECSHVVDLKIQGLMCNKMSHHVMDARFKFCSASTWTKHIFHKTPDSTRQEQIIVWEAQRVDFFRQTVDQGSGHCFDGDVQLDCYLDIIHIAQLVEVLHTVTLCPKVVMFEPCLHTNFWCIYCHLHAQWSPLIM